MPDSPWPVPPPFMWSCPVCSGLLVGVIRAAQDGGCVDQQDRLCRHIVGAHPDDVPAPHTSGCAICPVYAGRDDGDPGGAWAQHRARGLFMVAPSSWWDDSAP
ncbi:hypothetical protein ACIQU5_32175 [Streptomyces sp. NPDC090306]|uniref:hypothetical protein n=1 Tax=Streptomyces sp. NPDC090306 TaxID=3365961 RepID=UPI00380519D8